MFLKTYSIARWRRNWVIKPEAVTRKEDGAVRDDDTRMIMMGIDKNRQIPNMLKKQNLQNQLLIGLKGM